VLDAGPIPYREIELFGDPDLEHGLRHMGLEPDSTAYRLVELPVSSILDTHSMPNWRWASESMVEVMRNGVRLPPIVVFRAGNGWLLIDGINRTYAAWRLGIASLLSYELIGPPTA
jgi:hypothetical protein